MRNWKRHCRLIVSGADGDGIDLSMFKTTFKISQSNRRFPKEAVITIYNLSNETKNRIKKKEFTQISLIAGYETHHGLIFSGEISYVTTGREGTDTYLTMQVADGERAHNYAVVNSTLAAGYNSKDRLTNLIKNLVGFDIKEGITSVVNNITMPRGRPEFGMHRDAMDNLAQQCGANWYYNNGKLNFLPTSGYIKEIKLDSKSGLVGVPQGTINGGINIRCLINPNITVDTLIELTDSTINQQQLASVNFQSMATNHPATIDRHGKYKVINVAFIGDTRGNDWYMDLICVSVHDPVFPTKQLISQGL